MLRARFYKTLLIFIFTLFLTTACMYMSGPAPGETIISESSAFEIYGDAVILFDKGDYSGALEKVNAAIKGNDRIAKFFLLRAEILEKLNRPKDALSSYQQVLRLKLHNPDMYEKMGHLLAGMQRYEEGVQNIKKALAQKPEANHLLLTIADFYIREGSFDRADYHLNLYQNQVKTNQLDPNFFCLKAQIYFQRNQFKETIEILHTCQAKQKFAAASHLLMLNSYLNLDMYDELYRQLMDAAQNDLSRGDFHFYRGVYFFHKNNTKDALTQLNLALENDCQDSRVYFYLGKLYLQLGDSARSKEMFELHRIKTRQPELESTYK